MLVEPDRGAWLPGDPNEAGVVAAPPMLEPGRTSRVGRFCNEKVGPEKHPAREIDLGDRPSIVQHVKFREPIRKDESSSAIRMTTV
jgi:hypothetical protein